MNSKHGPAPPVLPPLLMAMDVGNTNLNVGVYQGDRLLRQWRVASSRHRSADEYGLDLLGLVRRAGFQPADLTASALASVVPPLTTVLVDACRRYFGHEALVVGPGLRGLKASRYDDPGALGADRLANVVAAWVKYGDDPRARAAGVIAVADFGTATKVEAVSVTGEYLGGAIAPGVGISAQALYRHAARLPRVELARPARVLGRNNVGAIQSGLTYGFVGQVAGLLDRMAGELGVRPFTVATGGFAGLVAAEWPDIQELDAALTLEGVRILYQWNRPDAGLPAP